MSVEFFSADHPDAITGTSRYNAAQFFSCRPWLMTARVQFRTSLAFIRLLLGRDRSHCPHCIRGIQAHATHHGTRQPCIVAAALAGPPAVYALYGLCRRL